MSYDVREGSYILGGSERSQSLLALESFITV